VRAVDLGDQWETVVDDLDVRLVGPPGLLVEDADGNRELRLLRIGGRADRPNDPIDSADGRFAILRSRDTGRVQLSIADLLWGTVTVGMVEDLASARAALGPWLRERLAAVRAAAADRRPRPGLECGMCRFVAGCRAHQM
jgi:hypothetical protein